MSILATWLRAKDDKWFAPFFARHPEIQIANALKDDVDFPRVDGLLLTGGPDVAPEFLRQPIPNPGVLDKDVDPARDRWELDAIEKAMARGVPILAICKGMQILNVA